MVEYDNLKGTVGPGIWGYTPALARMQGTTAVEDTEYLATFYGPVAFLEKGGKSVKSLLTGHLGGFLWKVIPTTPLVWVLYFKKPSWTKN